MAAAAVAELGALLVTLARLALLDLAGTGIGPRGLRSLGAQPDAFQVSSAMAQGMAAAAVAELGALLVTLARLALLDLAGTGIGPRGLRSLGAQPDAFQVSSAMAQGMAAAAVAELGALLVTLARLALLDLAGTGIGPRGLRSLGAQPDAFQVSSAMAQGMAAAAVAELGALLVTLARLALLDLAGTGIGPRGLRSLGAQPDAFQVSSAMAQGMAAAAVAELGALLVTLARLALLDLAGTGIGPRGLRSLGAQPDAFQSLQELDLSLNPLGACGGRALAELLAQCPALVTLHVRGCGLTEPFPIPEQCPLRTLSLSYNALAPALGRLLPMIPARSIRSLELASVGGHGAGAGTIAGAIADYLEQDGCALSHLSLAGNHLGDGDIREVARSLARCPSLVSLELSANAGIGAGSLRILLEALEKRSRGLEFLSLAGCGVRDVDEATWRRSTGKIRDLRLPGRRLWKGP
ncbi:tonsoku-like protein [Aphelocoma coerulescens]|uniref:tonsoku-like protein n=1 Tax=Aphelocoma coerulescens TaxID=39617 RepID=UPI003604CDF1